MDRLTTWKRQLLPRALPQLEGWEWAAHCSESLWPGGDYFDVSALNAKKWLVFVGDASGHGGAAAVLTALARMLLHSCPLTSDQERAPFCPVHGWTQSPPIIAGRLNRALAENTLDEQFMTAFLGEWNPETARVDFVLAGQAQPLLWREATGRMEKLAHRGGLPFGIAPGEKYSACRVTLAPGDAMVVCTDGLIEARDSQGAMFGAARVESIIQEAAPQGAEAIKAGLLAGLHAFLQGMPPQDDVTFLILKRCGNG